MLDKKKYFHLVITSFIIISIYVLPSNVDAASIPGWLQAHANGSFKLPQAYHGVSFCEYKGELPDYDSLKLAKDRALDTLCYQISVSIQSKFEDRIEKKGEYEEQHITSSLFISTRKVLSGIQEKKKWTDFRKHRHWVLLAIDKERADRQIEKQNFINEVIDRLEHKQDEVLEGIREMTTVLNNTMRIYNNRMDQFENLLKTIDSKVEDSGAQIKDEYVSLRQEIMQLESTRKAYENRLSDSERRQSKQIELLIKHNDDLKNMIRRLSEKIQGDYFLALTNDDIKNNDDSGFRVTIKPDKGQGADYYNGEKIRFLVRASRECYVKVIYLSSKDEQSKQVIKINTLLFPNVYDKDNWIDPGEIKVIGNLGELVIEPPFGKDIITVVASSNQFSDLQNLLDKSKGGYFSEESSSITDALRIRTRGIAVSRYDHKSSSNNNKMDSTSPSIATDTCFIVSHKVAQR